MHALTVGNKLMFMKFYYCQETDKPKSFVKLGSCVVYQRQQEQQVKKRQ